MYMLALLTSIPFYSKIFGCEPAVLKGDYAKWQLEDPKVNLAISARGPPEGIILMPLRTMLLPKWVPRVAMESQTNIGLMTLMALHEKYFIRLIQSLYSITDKLMIRVVYQRL